MINENEFLNEMQDVLDTEDELSLNMRLDELEDWDSLSFVNFLATMSEYTSERIDPKKVRSATTMK
jgi:acyl carrier protein